jgi:hypothetical protein
MKSKKLLPFISMILVLLLCFTGCTPATEEPVGDPYSISMRMNLEDVVVPETTGMYKFTQGFDDNLDMDALLKLVFGEDADIHREDGPSSVSYRCPAQLCSLSVTFGSNAYPYSKDGKQTAPLSLAKNMTMTMRDERAPYMATGDAEYNAHLYGAFYMYGFSAESGYIGEKLGEPGTDDPKMQNALAHSKAIMDFVYGDDYRQVCAYKYSRESSVELWKLLGAYGDLLVSGDRDPVTGMIQMIPVGKYPLPDTELYYIQYNIIPDTLPAGVDTSDPEYFLRVRFLYDKDGVVGFTLFPPISFEPIQTGTPCTAQQALEAAQQGMTELNADLWSMKYTLKKLDDTRYVGAYELHYTTDATHKLEQKELDLILATGAKGKYNRSSRFVYALDGVPMDVYNDSQYNIMIHKYNNPELYAE